MSRKKYQISEAEYKATINRLNEIFDYHTPSYTIDEDEANNKMDFGQDGGEDMPPVGDEGGMPQGGGQQPPMGGGEQEPPMGGEGMDAPPQGGTDMGGDMPQGGTEGPEGFNPQGDITADEFNAAEQPTPDDNVVDISDLTDAQEATDSEIAQLGGKFEKVLNTINAFTELIKSNDAKIEDLKKEFERRNPTQVEKMSLHTAKGEPFNTSPEDYWEKKSAETNYSPDSDNDGKGMPQYAITANDINSGQDWKNIAASISPDEDDDEIMYSQSLKSLLGL